MGSEALYREVENFKTGGALSSEELDGLYKKRQSYNSRKALRTISGIVYFSILVFILLAFFCNPVRSFVLSQLKLSGDFLYGNILSGSFWKIRGAVFFAALIANYFLFYWKFPFFWETIGATIFSGVLLLGSVLSPYLGLLGLLLSFLASFVVNTLEDDIKKAESKRKDEIYNIALKDNDLRLMQLLSGIQCEKAITYLSRKEKEEKEREAEQQKQAEKTNQMMQDMLCGEALYNEAISSEPPLKENLMKEAARLGSINACCYIGKSCFLSGRPICIPQTKKRPLPPMPLNIWMQQDRLQCCSNWTSKQRFNSCGCFAECNMKVTRRPNGDHYCMI